MIKIMDVRMQSNKTMREFSQELGISLSTLGRIELAEIDGKQYMISRRGAYQIVNALNQISQEAITISDLAGIAIAPRRTGRPKKASEAQT